ncbi:MAG: T9SS type A sorting domain-containing protein [Bacteroidales bacterium]|nr:T9SS type A sorting domain-containing protein [Bacteroidales bacterium]MBR4148467.1 T9SS type A sorting domain-containing protein [Bacteroidales bacterium]
MKKTVVFLFAIAFSLLSRAQNVSFEQYFLDEGSLRMDVFQCGNFNSSHYVFERFIIEPYFGGSKVNLIDPFNYGTNRVKVIDAQTNTLIYSRGYNTLFREWQTTEEATRMERCYEESVSVPLPRNEAYVILEIRNFDGEFEEIFSKLYEPNEMFNTTEQRYVFPVYDVMVNGTPESKVDIVILPEGYTADEMSQFEQHCQSLVDVFAQQEPFASHLDDFNFRAVLAPSEESGVDIPASHNWVRTILNSHFYTFYIDRYCTTRDYFSVKDVAANAPYDQIYILVNSSQYGGGGFYNFYSMSTAGNMSSASVIIHEFGHAFAGLADEYEESDNPLALLYNLDVEPWEPNITTLVDFESKWADLVAPNTPIPTPNNYQYYNTVGAFEGGGYLTHGMYRPQHDCMMRNYALFCAVCSRTIEDVIEAHSDVLVSVKPGLLLSEPSLRVCPNPATDFIDVFVRQQEDDMAEIIDINGKTVMSVRINNEVNRILISDLPQGVYMFRANGETRKFVKQ